MDAIDAKAKALSDLQVGEQVAIVADHRGGSSAIIRTITAVTSNKITIGDKSYRRNTGTRLGGAKGHGSWADSPEYLMVVDSPIVQGIMARDLVSRLAKAVGSVDVPGDVEGCLKVLDRIEVTLKNVRGQIEAM